jgi:hypothetical protein
MYWADKIADFKKQTEKLDFKTNRLDYDTLRGINTDLRKHLQPIDSLCTSCLRLKGLNERQGMFRNASLEYKEQRFLIAKQETLELIANIELILHQLTAGQYTPKP